MHHNGTLPGGGKAVEKEAAHEYAKRFMRHKCLDLRMIRDRDEPSPERFSGKI
jgi:hypothetical protein